MNGLDQLYIHGTSDCGTFPSIDMLLLITAQQHAIGRFHPVFESITQRIRFAVSDSADVVADSPEFTRFAIPLEHPVWPMRRRYAPTHCRIATT